MAKQNRAVVIEVLAINFDGATVEKPVGASFSITDESVQQRAGGKRFNWLDESVASNVEGSIEFSILTPDSAKALYGGNTVVSGHVHHVEESVTVADYVALAFNPVVSGSIQVYSNDGTILFNENKAGAPAIGEFAWSGGDGLQFNSSETETTVKVNYSDFSLSGQEYNLADTTTSPYGDLLLVGKGRQIDSDTVVYPIHRFPKARITSMGSSLGQAEVGNITMDFTALADSNGKAYHFYTISG